MTKKYVCIHGHFYQPPRENPWLNTVEMQHSAYPFHDWNERITAECYARNTASRILNGEGKIEDIVNNYSRISFNLGPTLMNWLKLKARDIYDAIIEADKKSVQRFNGHGSAIAQAYNHLIMPLANKRDQETQVKWGIYDFEYHFGRKPEGMWLPETAVNTGVLEVLAGQGITYTILSPYQAKRVRKDGDKDWKEVEGGHVDPRRAYACKLPSGKKINLFFYDGPISQGIAFEGLLSNGEAFAKRLMGPLKKDDQVQLTNIATDGETYGHHHRFGEMALSYSLHYIEQNREADLTIYGDFLEKYPPEWEAEIVEDSSWSCAHGIERWRSDCGCNTGGNADWNQKWRKPLRGAFDWVRDNLNPVYDQQMTELGVDPWEVRNNYIEVILNRSKDDVNAFMEGGAGRTLNHDEKVKMLKLLEMEHHLLLMYTSCGWFFDEVTGIESMQDIYYATRAIQLGEELTGEAFGQEFEKKLEQIPSNIPEFQTAATAYRKYVKPTQLDLLRVGAHYGVASIFSEELKRVRLYSFYAHNAEEQLYEAGHQKMLIGQATICSEITWEEQHLSYAILYMGDHHLFGGVRAFKNSVTFELMKKELSEAYERSNVHELMNLMDKHFKTHNYSFWHLFRDEQHKVINSVLSNKLLQAELLFERVFNDNYPMMKAINEIDMELPIQLSVAAELVINHRFRKIFESSEIKEKELQKTTSELHKLQVKIDTVTLNFLATQHLERLVLQWEKDSENKRLMNRINNLVHLLREVPLKPDLWKLQNLTFMLKRNYYRSHKERAHKDKAAHEWTELFEKVMQTLNIQF